MKKVFILLLSLIISSTVIAQEKKEKDTPIKSYQLHKEKKVNPSKRNPFLKKEEIIIPELKKEQEQREEAKVSYTPHIEFKGFLTSKNKKLALIYIDGNEALVEEGEVTMNLKILSIQENEIEIIYLLTNENLKIPFTGGEH